MGIPDKNNSMLSERVLFVYIDYDPWDPTVIGGTVPHGIPYLAGALNREKISYKLFHLIKCLNEKELEEAIHLYNDFTVFAFSFTSPQKDEAYKIARIIKRLYPEKYIIVGGTHATVDPADILKNDDINCLCVGEGEDAIAEIVKNYRTGDLSTIPNIQYKIDGKVYKNNLSMKQTKSLDEFPIPDYSIFNFPDLHCYKARIRYLPIMLSRGCPYNCSYCSNYVVFKVSKESKRIITRIYSPRKAIDLIKENLKLADFRSVNFDDDIIGIDKEWNREFFVLYKKEINLPFKFYVRPEYVTEEFVKLAADAGCYRVTFGLEVGNEKIRYEILNKRTKDKLFEETFKLFHKYEIEVNTTNIIAVPTETMKDALLTLKVNAKLNVDHTLRGVFQPYPYTALYDYVKKHNLYADTNKEMCSSFEGSVLKFENFSHNQIEFVMAAWNLLFIIYRKLYQLPQSELLVKLFDLCIYSMRPLYPFAIFLRNKFFIGKLSTYLYRVLEKELKWLEEDYKQQQKGLFSFFRGGSNSKRAATLAEYCSPEN